MGAALHAGHVPSLSGVRAPAEPSHGAKLPRLTRVPVGSRSATAMVRGKDSAPADGGLGASVPRIRSFVVRAGRIGPGQARALTTLAPRFVLPFVEEPVDFARVFGRVAPLVVEIGFGMGSATAAIAA